MKKLNILLTSCLLLGTSLSAQAGLTITPDQTNYQPGDNIALQVSYLFDGDETIDSIIEYDVDFNFDASRIAFNNLLLAEPYQSLDADADGFNDWDLVLIDDDKDIGEVFASLFYFVDPSTAAPFASGKTSYELFEINFTALTAGIGDFEITSFNLYDSSFEEHILSASAGDQMQTSITTQVPEPLGLAAFLTLLFAHRRKFKK
ncbi:hypothetical protein [Gayadomonas joobiniege]|uniref:hypothetical protein n=1 Tax=Gayadomonas joobiniege TaxID=1234606 RepID=UPI0003639EDC|nr:hypothetical protein [Gayadomonas joobiniege]